VRLAGLTALPGDASLAVMSVDQFALAPLRIGQLYEQIAGRLRDEIAAGALPPGARLPSERDLARALEVGRPSVREAIAALKNDGLVETRAGAGTFVTADAPALLLDAPAASPDTSVTALLEARAELEPAIAALAARRGERDPELEALLESMSGVASLGDPAARARWRDGDRAFHRRLAALTGNPLLARVGELVAATMDEPLWRRLHDDAVTDVRRARVFAAEHRLIYEAVADGDPEAAALYAGRHVERVRRDITG
jgi:DNA-binding FadR family transcriptional regulator